MRKPELLLALLLSSFCVLGVSAVEDDALVLYLPFDEGSGTDVEDLSGNGNDGVINGDVQWVDGKMGGGLEFGGNTSQFVEVLDSESLRFGKEPFTYMAWIEPYALQTPQSQTLISKRVPVAGDGMETATLFIRSQNDYLFVEFRDNIQGMFAFEAADAVVTKDTWQHVAWVKDDAELRFYVDGKLMHETEHDRVGTVNGTQSLYIGVHRYGGTWNAPYTGVIDEVAVFRAALNENDIKQLMKNVLPVEPLEKLTTTWGVVKE